MAQCMITGGVHIYVYCYSIFEWDQLECYLPAVPRNHFFN